MGMPSPAAHSRYGSVRNFGSAAIARLLLLGVRRHARNGLYIQRSTAGANPPAVRFQSGVEAAQAGEAARREVLVHAGGLEPVLALLVRDLAHHPRRHAHDDLARGDLRALEQ